MVALRSCSCGETWKFKPVANPALVNLGDLGSRVHSCFREGREGRRFSRFFHLNRCVAAGADVIRATCATRMSITLVGSTDVAHVLDGNPTPRP